MKKISIIAPMYNEEQTAEIYLSEMVQTMSSLKGFDYEIIAVDDGSNDKTLSILLKAKEKYPNLGVVKLSRNFGLEGAIHAGIQSASGDAVITMDADLQDPPSLIPELIDLWQKGYDVVNAKRTQRLHDSLFKRCTAAAFYKLFKKLSGNVYLEENVANYRLLSRKVIDTIKLFPEVNRVFRLLIPFTGFKVACVEYSRNKRYAGITKYSFTKLVRYAADCITSSGVEPLKYITLFTLLFFALCGIFELTSLILFFLNKIQWWIPVLILPLLLLFSLQFLSIGIISEYISQIFIEVKHRPPSIIQEFLPPDK